MDCAARTALRWAISPALLFCVRPALGDARYRIVDLGPNTIPNAINNAGQIAGSTGDHAFLWSDGQLQELQGLVGELVLSWGYGINAKGEIAGQWSDFAHPSSRAFVYRQGTMQDLGALGGQYCTAYDINGAGQIVGTRDSQAFIYSDGVVSSLTGAGTSSWALAINAKGVIVGGIGTRAFIYADGALNFIGTLGGSESEAQDINDAGQVVGWSLTSAPDYKYHAFLYSEGLMIDLGTLGGRPHSRAFGINARGDVVGKSFSALGWFPENPPSDMGHAFLYQDSTLLDLNDLITVDSGWVLRQANAINDDGWIVGFGDYWGSGNEGFLLIPAVPEPATVALLFAGLGILARRSKRIAASR